MRMMLREHRSNSYLRHVSDRRSPATSRGRPSRAFPLSDHTGIAQLLQNAHLITLADIMPDISPDTAQAAAQGAAAASGPGPFDWLARAFESVLTRIDGVLEAVHVPYSYGFSIIILTLLVKAATFPLTQKQVESTLKVQAISPQVKALQAKFPNDQERLQLETAKLYREANVNPLAGCLPTLATIPVFIGLYRALTLAAQDGLLKEGFFFVPSLGGPATIEQQLAGQGTNWLLPFVDGQPPLGWETTIKYLALPVLLIISQYVSMAIAQPANSDDPQVKQTQTILKVLPVMIGWFSLNVPSGLCIYWLTNNVLSTGQQMYLKSTIKVDPPVSGGSTASKPVIDVTATSGTVAELSGTRRSQRGEKFRARKALEKDKDASVTKNARGKKKGSKFAERKKAEAVKTTEPSRNDSSDAHATPSAVTVALNDDGAQRFPDGNKDVVVVGKKEDGSAA